MGNETNTVAGAMAGAGESLMENASEFLGFLKPYLTWEFLFKAIGLLILAIVLRLLYKLALKAVNRIPAAKTTPQRTMLIQKFLKYLFFTILGLFVLSFFGIKLSAIWGAAGIAGIAIGFAAQTSVSNLISGIFVLTEGTLKVGDTIIVGDVTGIVDSVNLLSVRVHTFDNQMVRLPNSTVLNSNLTNNSYFKVRRITISVSVAYPTDLEKALAVLQTVAARCPHVEPDPASTVWLNSFDESGIEFVVAAWFKPENFLAAKNELFINIKKTLDESGIEIPYNKLDVKIINE
ncbi:MAG: mechanosensitive ion channel family protein [Treponemataceae bacterium]|nr:mechanosensitive ion channel family protein [Treponemataceae bacterium]